MINFTQNFFDLEILKISDIKLHETTKAKKTQGIFLTGLLKKDRRLMNPVIVATDKHLKFLIDAKSEQVKFSLEIGCN